MEEKLSKSRFNRDKGQSLFEVIIAIAISAGVMVSVVALASTSIRNATFSRNKTVASRYAQEATEWLRGERDKDISGFVTKTQTQKWCLNSLNWSNQGACGSGEKISGTQFFREVDFSEDTGVTQTIIQASVRVFWSDAQGSHEVRSVTNFSDWRQR